MPRALREQRTSAAAGLVAAAVLAAAAGCESGPRRRAEPVRVVVVPARSALAGYRVPEYVPRDPVEPRRQEDPPHDSGQVPPIQPRRRAHPEWAAARPRAWRYIVIHHSHTDRGNADIFDRFHRQVRHWENGLGYHFVIGNGNDSGDGEVEVGSRWRRQLQGAHAGVALYNDFGIGICLVGDFETGRPTQRQLTALVELVDYLAATFSIPRKNILRHGDIKNTKCPGKNFPFDELFRR